ncbi:MAG: 23S rRNA (pseudouridine(1915)-N(3))-methyltransferase RlmH [Deltaproteobacteria bacterium]|nr:23S rRNA (pseudouridine(1915)-N(3))-methyltransferase RlmH [Deltaproteobacteria bacterium]
MKFELIVLGKTNEEYLAAGIADFQKRLQRYCQVTIKTVKERRGRIADKARLREEGSQLLAQVAADSLIVALDRTGRQLSSLELAENIGRWRDSGKRVVTFIIGGPLGLSPEVLERAAMVISLSKMTFTHEMARLLLFEQLYRGFAILAGTKYHK